MPLGWKTTTPLLQALQLPHFVQVLDLASTAKNFQCVVHGVASKSLHTHANHSASVTPADGSAAAPVRARSSDAGRTIRSTWSRISLLERMDPTGIRFRIDSSTRFTSFSKSPLQPGKTQDVTCFNDNGNTSTGQHPRSYARAGEGCEHTQLPLRRRPMPRR